MALLIPVLGFLDFGEISPCVHALHALGEQNHLYKTF